MSAGRAATRIVVGVVLAVIVAAIVVKLLPSREKRLREFVDSCRAALVAGNEADFLAHFDAEVKYQADFGLAEIRRDFRRYRSLGLPAPTILDEDLTLDDAGADVRIDAVIVAGLRPIGKYVVRLRAVDPDDRFRIVSVRWE